MQKGIDMDRNHQDSLGDIAFMVASKFFISNKDRSLELEDFIQEITIKLSLERGKGRDDPAWLWKVASNTAIDLLRRAKYRASVSIDAEVIEGKIKTDISLHHSPPDPQGVIDQIHNQQIIDELPDEILDIGKKLIDKTPTDGSERVRLSRFRKSMLRKR